MAVSDNDVKAELTAAGGSIEDYFLIGHDICAINSSGLLTSLLVEDVEGEEEGEMHNAIVDFLRRCNAKMYQSYDDYIRQRANP
jgi:hypothetical protein